MRKNSNKFDVDIDYNPAKTKELQKILKENWNNFDVDFRIAAVIHDGQWYTLDKIKKVAKVKDIKVVENWVARHKQILIKHEVNDSYRVNTAEILRWYQQNNLKIGQEIVPKNYPPRLWAGKTETENFLDAPKEVLFQRVLSDTQIRPVVFDAVRSEYRKDYFFDLYNKRKELYEKFANLTIDTETTDADLAIREIIEYCKSENPRFF